MMTGSVLDILIYVFDRYMLEETPEVPEREQLARDLEWAGFARGNVERALDWLTELAFGHQRPPLPGGSIASMLLILELDGCVAALPGGRYDRIPE